LIVLECKISFIYLFCTKLN